MRNTFCTRNCALFRTTLFRTNTTRRTSSWAKQRATFAANCVRERTVRCAVHFSTTDAPMAAHLRRTLANQCLNRGMSVTTRRRSSIGEYAIWVSTFKFKTFVQLTCVSYFTQPLVFSVCIKTMRCQVTLALLCPAL